MKIDFLHILKFTRNYLNKRTQLLILSLILISILVGIFDLISIYLLKNINEINLSISDKESTYIELFFLIFLLMFFLKIIQMTLNRLFLVQCEEDLTNHIFRKNLNSNYIDSYSFSDGYIVSLMTYEVKRFILILKSIVLFLSGGIILFSIFLALLIFNYHTTLFISLISGLLLIIFFIFLRKKYNFYSLNLTNENQIRSQSILQILNGFISIRSLNLEKYFSRKFQIANNKIKKLSFYSEIFQQLPVKLVELMIISTIFIIYFVNKNYPDFILIKPHFFVYFYAFYRTYPLIKDMYSMYGTLSNNQNAYFELKKFLLKNEPSISNTEIAFSSFNNYKLKNICIKRNNKTIINNISIDIYNTKILGIFGRSGSGKTSLALAISGLIKIDYGEVFIDKQKINLQNSTNFRKNILYVGENPFLISGTLEQNLFQKNIISNEVDDLFKVTKLNGFDLKSFIDSDNENISYGQKQKIVLMRSILANPRILILDEALNGMDLDSIKKILFYLKSKKSTVVLITHNKEILNSFCDNIFEIN